METPRKSLHGSKLQIWELATSQQYPTHLRVKPIPFFKTAQASINFQAHAKDTATNFCFRGVICVTDASCQSQLSTISFVNLNYMFTTIRHLSVLNVKSNWSREDAMNQGDQMKSSHL